MKPTIVRTPNANAPKELEEVAFLAGVWDLGVMRRQPDGSQLEGAPIQMVATYTLDGFAFQDDIIAPYGSGLGTTWRTYDTEKSQWACRWLQAGTDTCPTFTNDWFYGNTVDGELRLRGVGVDEVGDFEDRIIFGNISHESWVWTLSRSHDGGETWTENVRTYEATRRE